VRPADSGRYPSGQRGQTVNLLAYAFGGSNPPLPTIVAGAFEAGFHRGWAEKGAATRGMRASAVEACAFQRSRDARFGGRGMGSSAVEACVVPRLRKVHVALQFRQAHGVLLSGGNSSAVERQPSKLGVAGSNPVSRSRSRVCAHVAQSAERVLGKDEVSGSIPDMGSRIHQRASAGALTTLSHIATANGRA
jgi:hypothetical protein